MCGSKSLLSLYIVSFLSEKLCLCVYFDHLLRSFSRQLVFNQHPSTSFLRRTDTFLLSSHLQGFPFNSCSSHLQGVFVAHVLVSPCVLRLSLRLWEQCFGQLFLEELALHECSHRSEVIRSPIRCHAKAVSLNYFLCSVCIIHEVLACHLYFSKITQSQSDRLPQAYVLT